MRFLKLLLCLAFVGLTSFYAASMTPLPDELPLNGVFSVGAGKTVRFSKGNLQFHPMSDTWRFAPQQNFTCGSGNMDAINKTNSAYYMDLFSWGTSGVIWRPDAAYMNSSSTYYEHRDIANTSYDWGVFNSRSDGNAIKWRTLTRNEWIYMLFHRDRADELLAYAQVSENQILKKSGLILLPDNWDESAITFKLKTVKDLEMEKNATFYQLYTFNPLYWSNVIDEAAWLEMQALGAVFLPATGLRVGTNAIQGPQDGYYWTSSCASYDFASGENPNKDSAGGIHFWTTPEGKSGLSLIHANVTSLRFLGVAVRLVTDLTDNDFPTSVIHATDGHLTGIFSLSETEKVHFAQGNLQYNPSMEQWQFAPDQFTITASSNFNPSIDSSSWIDMFGWATSGHSLHFPYETSTYSWTYGNGNKDIHMTMLDWALTNPITNGGNRSGMWRTPTSIEMEYLLCHRPDATQKTGLGSVDGVNGLIILPDDWVAPEDISFVGFGNEMRKSGGYYYSPYSGHFSNNQYTREQWTKLEKHGALFLPLTGCRVGSTYQQGSIGYYWTSSTSPNGLSDDSHALSFFSDGQTLINPHYEINKCFGLSLRPVTPVDNSNGNSSDLVLSKVLTPETTVSIYDIYGSIQYEGRYNACPSLPKGIYIIRFGVNSSIKLIR